MGVGARLGKEDAVVAGGKKMMDEGASSHKWRRTARQIREWIGEAGPVISREVGVIERNPGTRCCPQGVENVEQAGPAI